MPQPSTPLDSARWLAKVMLDGINDGLEVGFGEFDKPPRTSKLATETDPFAGPVTVALRSQPVSDFPYQRVSDSLEVDRIVIGHEFTLPERTILELSAEGLCSIAHVEMRGTPD